MAYTHIEHGLAFYNPQEHSVHTLLYCVDDPGVCGQAFAAKALWFLGYSEQAVGRSDAAITQAAEGLPPAVGGDLRLVH
jgi:hypothetical protein